MENLQIADTQFIEQQNHVLEQRFDGEVSLSRNMNNDNLGLAEWVTL